MAPVTEEAEDLAHTPAERAAAARKAEDRARRLEEEIAAFEEAEEGEIGTEADEIVVIGAGLVGALCAVVLQRKGFKVTVYERYGDIREIPSLGRSINLSVTSRGLRAIRGLGGDLYERVLGLATQVTGRIIHMPDGAAVFQRYGKDDSEHNYSISRIDLNKLLINTAVDEGVQFNFAHTLSETSDFAGKALTGCTLNFTRTGNPDELTRVKLHVRCPVIACDGAGSRVRYALKSAGLTSFTEDVLPRGYKEVLFPHPGDNDFGAPSGDGIEGCPGRYGLHIWPRGDHMLMALANRDGSFTGTIYMDNQGPESFAAFDDTPDGRQRCEAFCAKHYSHAVPLVGGMESLVTQITTNPNGVLGTVRTTKWAIEGKILLIGDACHAMVPFFGQGCNCGFEDTLWLSRLLDKHCCLEGKCAPEKCHGENFAQCFQELEDLRKPNADAMCNMSLENFVEMRDKSGDVRFQAMKKVENRLENTFPSKFRSRYAMVCYGGDGNVSYANAFALGLVQAKILESLCNDVDCNCSAVANNINLEEAERLIDETLVPFQEELGIDLATVKH